MQPDDQILALIKQNEPSGWEYLYDKFAPVIYGIILQKTQDKKVAEKILIKYFLHLKHLKFLDGISLCLQIVKDAHIFCNNYLHKKTSISTVHPIGKISSITHVAI